MLKSFKCDIWHFSCLNLFNNLGGGEKCRIIYEGFLERSFTIFELGKLNFPKKAFADKNFHCGFYADGDNLEQIIHFRKDTLEDYFKMEAEKFSPFMKIITTIFMKPVKWFLLHKSEPHQAFKNNNTKEINHYFN